MENREIARLLSEVADLMEIGAEDGFRIRSYRNAASTIESYPERIDDILRNPERRVTDIPGIGKGIAAVLEEIGQRGTFQKRDHLLEQYPATLLELLRIQGLGSKGVALLYQHYKVATIDDLERICKEQKLRELPRMGAKLEEKVLKSIAQYRQRAGRFLLSFGKKTADELIPYLSETGGLDQIAAAGSLRRGKDTIGDLDLLVTGPKAPEALECFVNHPKVHAVLGKGPNKASIQYGLEGLQVDLRALPHESYGAAMQYFTGSKEHNIILRLRAQKLGLTLSAWRAKLSRMCTPNWASPGFLRSCAKTAARLRRLSKDASRNWWSFPTSAATCICTPPKPTAGPRWRKWPKPPAPSATNTSPSRTIPKLSPWPTVWMKREQWRSPSECTS